MKFFLRLFKLVFILTFLSFVLSNHNKQKNIVRLEKKLEKLLQSCAIATEGEDLKTPYGK